MNIRRRRRSGHRAAIPPGPLAAADEVHYDETATGLAEPEAWSSEDDTDYSYYDTPSGNIWFPGDQRGEQADGRDPEP